jgi:hypothetical protein
MNFRPITSGDVIEYSLPHHHDFGVGCVLYREEVNGIVMPWVTDQYDHEYPVHPSNIENVEKINDPE